MFTVRSVDWRALPLSLGLLAFAIPAPAQTADQTFTIASVTVTAPPKIDGTLDDPVWKSAAHVQLQWDFTFRRPAAEATDAYLIMDQKYLYVAFVSKQTETIVATQHTNDQPLGADDVVRIYLWPGGDQGFEYGFVTNPVGARYQFSSENAAFSPVWDVVAKTTSDGWIATERIPLNIMRGDGRKTWRVQFDRRIRNSNQVVEWAHAEAQGDPDSSLYAGYLQGMTVSANSVRAKPRLNVYELAQFASKAAGGSTSRVGADLAIPITQTASFIATFHPDYSNVELDQQSISPTTFPRRFQEVRPFFTQGAGFYNNFNCNDCVGFPLLYTPAIPTPTTGYAVEGSQGTFNFGAFSALGVNRTDSAQATTWSLPNRRAAALFQRQTVDMPDVHDVASFGQVRVGNAHNFSVYATAGAENGTFVPDPSKGKYYEYGVNLYTPKSGFFAAYHDVGSQYGPVDSFTQFNNVVGPTAYAFREFDYGPKSFIQSLVISEDYNRFHSHAGVLNYTNNSTAISIATRNKFYFEWDSGSNWLNLGGPAGFANQGGIYLSYGGQTSTPTTFSYYLGRFGAGYLHSITRSTTLKIGPRGTLTLQANNTRDALDSGVLLQQWLERVSFGYQIGAGETFAIGVRKIIGAGPPFFGPARFINATNISFALYKRIPYAEIYFAYGDPNRLQTQHDVILKLIQYFGADKGT